MIFDKPQIKNYRKLYLKQISSLIKKGHSQLVLLWKSISAYPEIQCSLLTSAMLYQQAYQKILLLLKDQNRSSNQSILPIQQLQKKSNQKQDQCAISQTTRRNCNFDQIRCWLVICLFRMGRQKQGKQQMQKIEKQNFKAQLQSYLQKNCNRKEFTIEKMMKNQVKNQIRQIYQRLLQKANFDNYFRQQNVPVYILNTKWIQSFYEFVLQKNASDKFQMINQQEANDEKESTTINQRSIKPVDNRHLADLLSYVDDHPNYHHLNYQIKRDYKQNYDFKLISYQLWQFLSKNFGGIQLKRFTTQQKNPSVEVYYRKLNILVTQENYIMGQFQLMCSKFESIKKIVERVKRLSIKYEVCEFEAVKSLWQGFIVKNIGEQHPQQNNGEYRSVDQNNEFHNSRQKVIQAIQDSSPEKPFDQTFDGDVLKIPDYRYTVQQCEIYDSHILLFNIVAGTVQDMNNSSTRVSRARQQSIFKDIEEMKDVEQKPKCLACGSPDQIILCTCGSVYFCSNACKSASKEHIKACKNIMKQKDIVTGMITKYNALKRQFDIKSHQFIQKSAKVGLQNLGNTCYMNSALQCILRIEEISKFFLKNQHLKDVNVSNVLGSQGHLAFAYAEFVKDYYSTNRKALQPVQILKIIAKNPQFRGHNHQDSQQFLNYFFDKLHEDLNRVKKKPYIEEVESNGRSDQEVSKQSWQSYLKRNQSFIAETLTGQYRSEIQCPDCDKISITFDPFMSVTLPFPKQEKTLEIIGYYQTEEGQFKKVQQKVKANMKSKEFCDKIFNVPVVPIHLVNKKICAYWNMQATVFKNYQDKGILMFYPKPETDRKLIAVDIQVVKSKQIESFNRRIYFVQKIESKQVLKDAIYKNIKKPLTKAMKVNIDYDEDIEGYLNMCREADFLVFLKGSQTDVFPEFPFSPKIQDYNLKTKQSGVDKVYNLKLRIQIQRKKVSDLLKIPDVIKFNLSSGEYSSKQIIKTQSINDPLTLQSMINSFNEPQQLTEDNTWYCNQCKEHKEALKIMSIYRVPKYLIVHFKRFNHRGNRYVIYGQKVKTPIILKEVQIINGFSYQMIGIVNHFGSLSFGHYTAFVKKQNNEWFYYDDESVKRRKMDGDNVYLAIYKQLGSSKEKQEQY